MIQQKTRSAEQQTQRGAPQTDPAMHFAQPFDEGSAARALLPCFQFVSVEPLRLDGIGVDGPSRSEFNSLGYAHVSLQVRNRL